ncbi:MAG TPA: GtrA family protein [Candidatus Saccharimonadales bacterium]|nr:GtrA family protein [Candidatus Saccharimonadales bacterium]
MKKTYTLFVATYYKLIAYDKIRFLIVGGIGFVVNYAALTLLFHILKLPITFAQILAAETAILSTFAGNNFWAFTHHQHISFKKKIIRFHVSSAAGQIINSSCVILLVYFIHLYYGLALVVGSLAGLVWNYTLYKRFVFKVQPARNSS